ncbi:chemotaxis protein CheX [Sporomusa acidovorans]|uniref:Chemotaxis phosphatase CheX-like domain-containing protein n=1 Tax=Sporomusa acidovorans (strain ATCC 49682 / DSM 3132 / Mol) TaxID=1123286 RepID=A0ABZ3IZ11_SPOA4|nr:chemotaxis protein CheX [Sporomusa acidovorans]OZC14115.1 CheC-like family protein [Sporomusa acidovorans DSM 3132]SDE68696.1 chemotaxis protein CheX [Sporomusa acidovorans]
MDARLVNPFITALSIVLPQMGFKNVARGKLFSGNQFIDNQGVLINVALINNLTGNFAFTMTEESAKRLSSVIMMGTPVNTFDAMAQSALCEMVNIVASNAATSLNKEGIAVNLVPPALSQTATKLKICDTNYIGIEMVIDELPVAIGIGLN